MNKNAPMIEEGGRKGGDPLPVICRNILGPIRAVARQTTLSAILEPAFHIAARGVIRRGLHEQRFVIAAQTYKLLGSYALRFYE